MTDPNGFTALRRRCSTRQPQGCEDIILVQILFFPKSAPPPPQQYHHTSVEVRRPVLTVKRPHHPSNARFAALQHRIPVRYAPLVRDRGSDPMSLRGRRAPKALARPWRRDTATPIRDSVGGGCAQCPHT